MVDSDLDARLRAIESKIEETHVLVAQMRRVQRNAHIMKLFYWVIIVVLAIFSISMIKPYISQLGAAYGITDKEGGPTSKANLLKQLQEFQQNN